MATCPNINLPEWKELVAAQGKARAYFLWNEYSGDVPKSEYDVSPNKVSYSLKSVNILLSEKAKQIFSKAKNVGWDLNKTLTELQIPKDQKVYIQEVYDNISYVNPETNKLIEPSIEDLVTSILANNSFTVEVNTATEDITNKFEGSDGENTRPNFIVGDYTYRYHPMMDNPVKYLTKNENKFDKNLIDITEEEYFKVYPTNNTIVPSRYYSNLTVPGGTNYVENEIATPGIKPNIKGHAQFSTDNGIGWFRSDDKEKQTTTGKINDDRYAELVNKEYFGEGLTENEKLEKLELEKGLQSQTIIDTKTRRILEVQSDLFQKGRGENNLTGLRPQEYLEKEFKIQLEGNNTLSTFRSTTKNGNLNLEIRDYDGWNKISFSNIRKSERSQIAKEIIVKYNDKDVSKNQFLQLLNKKGNWVNFFIQSIVQDSAKKGYEKVLFPTGSTAAKVEGHETLAIELTKINKRIEAMESTTRTDSSGYSYHTDLDGTTVGQGVLKDLIKRKEDLKTQGLEKLKPIEAFYTNRVTNILNKLYNVNKITDEYNNTWSEVTILPEILQQSILLQRKTTVAKKASPEVLSKVKKVIKKMGVDVQSLSEYAKQNPAVDVSSANALADLTAGIIAVSEGKEDVALTEEMVHIATAIIEQRDPKLVTEMISKIGRFQIYKDTLAEYKDSKAYQLPNGKPNIRKIKKEAVDKMIAAVITNDPIINLEEVDQSLFRRMWNTITDWFTGQYKKANINIFSKTAETVLGGEFEGSILDLNSTEIYYQLSDAQKNIQRELLETQKILRSVPVVKENSNPLLGDEISNEYELYVDGEWKKNPKRVTDKVKKYYLEKFKNKPPFTKEEDRDNELKKQLGIEFHDYFEEIHSRYFNKDGTRREVSKPRPVIEDSKKAVVYAKLETYYTNLIAEYSKDGKTPLVFSEIKVYNKKEKEAGTIDLLIIDENGKANIYDWKFMSMSKTAEDVSNYKQGAFGIQLKAYKNILQQDYGVKEIGKNRAVPISLELKRENFQDSKSPLTFTGIGIGSVNPTEIEPLYYTPVSEKSEKTGFEELDDLISKLNAVYGQISKTTPNDELSKNSKKNRLGILKQAIRQAQANENITPTIDALRVIQTEGENIIAEYKTIYEGRPAQSTDFENSQLSDFSSRINNYKEQASAFNKINEELSPILQAAQSISKEDKARIQIDIDAKARMLNINVSEIEKISGEFIDKFVGLRNNETGLLEPQALLRGLKARFRSLSELPLPSLRILSRLARIAQSKGQTKSLEDVTKLLEIRDKIKEKGGNLLNTVNLLYQKDKKGRLVNKLVYKYSKDFYDAVKDNAQEGNRSKAWLQNNVDLSAYKLEADKMIQKQLASNKEGYEDEELRKELDLKAKRMYDVTRNDFTGWDNYIIKRHPLSKWESVEYLNIKKDKDLLELYNFTQEMNDEAEKMGYLQGKIASTFLPFVRKGTAESLSWENGLSVLQNFGKSLTRRADDIGYGSINEITGETENGIPKYYTSDFSRTEDPEVNDMTDVSLEFFKNQILYIQQMNKYKYMKEIEGQINLVRTIVQAKDHYKTSPNSKVISEGGEPVVEKGNKNNAKIFDLFMETIMYDNAFPDDSEDFGIPTGKIRKGINSVWTQMTGKPLFKEGEKGTNYSIVKSMQVLNNAFQMKTLGLEPISGAVSLFGANIQVAAQSGNYFNFREYLKNELKVLGNWSRKKSGVETKQMKVFEQLTDLFMPLKDSPIYEKLKTSGVNLATRLDMEAGDTLFAFFRQPEIVLEKGLFMTLLDNTMVIDGKLINIPEFVRNKYKGRYDSAESFSAVKGDIESEIQDLKKNKSITNTSKLGENGKVEVPGLNLNDRKELQRITDLTRTLARNATGGFTDFDSIKMNMNIWTKSMMVFKGWIPKLVDTRFSEFRKVGDDFNVRVDENGILTGEKYDIGRIRLFVGNFLSVNILKSIRELRSIGAVGGTLNDEGLEKLDKMFEYYSTFYKETTGKPFNMSREDFIDMVRTNTRKQLQELLLLVGLNLMLFAVGFMEPDEDDRASKNWFYFQEKTLRRFQQELMFFYNPSEWSATLEGGLFPSLSLLSEMEKLHYPIY